jgi:hypothetical protein
VVREAGRADLPLLPQLGEDAPVVSIGVPFIVTVFDSRRPTLLPMPRPYALAKTASMSYDY